jgi:hypothetical protein
MRTTPDITEKDIRDALTLPDSFAYRGELPIGETWSLGPVILTRDSDLLGESNAKTIKRVFEEEVPADQWTITGCSHWACGWVEHLSFLVLDEHGEPTVAFCKLVEIQGALEQYPVLDEHDFSEREYEATLENIVSAGRNMVSDDAPEDWAGECLSWFWDNDQGAVEATDGGGGYPSEKEMGACLLALGWLDPESSYARGL